MRRDTISRPRASALAAGLVVGLAAALPAHAGDDSGSGSKLGRLFRLGGSSSTPAPGSPKPAASAGAPGSMGRSNSGSGGASDSTMTYYGQPAVSTPPSTPPGAMGGPKIAPTPRVNKGITDADPLVTRIALGKSDSGGQFGMFLQVFADGTLIDGEGVHKVGPEALKPIVEVISGGELAKLKGHCGGPAGDTFENFHVVAYDRSLGRLRASAFSYSGNPQGCEHAVIHLNKVLDDLQMRVSSAAPGTNPAMTSTAGTAPTASPAPESPLASPPLPLTTIP